MARQSKPESKLNLQIYEEACEWFIEFRGGNMDAERRREADRWLRKSPEQLSAYLEVAAIWNEGPTLVPLGKYTPEELISSALLEASNVVTLQEQLEAIVTTTDHDAPPSTTLEAPVEPYTSLRPTVVGTSRGKTNLFDYQPRAVRWFPRLSLLPGRALSTSVCGLALACGVFYLIEAIRTPTFTTRIGEQHSFQLSDGSTVSLNSRSKIRVRYSDQRREVELLAGQALFHVAKDSGRPFVVDADGTKVRAVGTEFDVYRKASGTLVTVVEGRVAVATDQSNTLSNTAPAALEASVDHKVLAPNLLFPPSEAGQSGNILLAAGEQLSVARQHVHKVEHANVANATAWTHRELVFESATLADVAEEFNRYNVRQLVVADAGLDTFHITGVFSSTDSASVIRFLNSRPGLRVVETRTSIQIERKIS